MSDAQPSYRRAVMLMTASSFVVPAAGLLTQPILAQGLGAGGRGALAAALAPAALILPVATLGLPEALTNLTAKRPSVTRPALFWAALVSSGLGALSLLVALAALPFLSAGDKELGNLITLATALTIPALVLGVFRGAAIGRQMWGAVAIERFLTAALRVFVFGALWLLGDLTVFVAVLFSCLTPIVAGLVYWKLLLEPPLPDRAEVPSDGGVLRPLLSFGSKVWFGAVASMMLGRIGQLLMTPLSSVEDMGLYVVATTISDVPLIVALAIQGALYGVNSKTNDATQITTTARLTTLVGFVGCAILGCSLPLWITPLFGPEFNEALIPSVMLLISSVICIPGLMAAAGLSAWGRPGLRSIGLIVALIVNIGVFVLLVPLFGVMGACWTSIISNIVLTGFMVLVGSRIMQVRAVDFLLVRRSDVSRLWAEALRLIKRMLASVSRTRSR